MLYNVESVRVTQSGMLLGTPGYMSPEQVEGKVDSVGAASDIYSLGVIFYELLTGRLPFQGPIAAILAQIAAKDPQKPSTLRPNLDRRLESICLRMMSKPIGKRFASMDEVADALSRVLKTPAERNETDTDAAIRQSQSESQQVTVLTTGDAQAVYRTARKCHAAHDYEQAVRLLEQIPERFRDPQIEELFDEAIALDDEVSYLLAAVEDADARQDYHGLLPSVERLLELKPGHRQAFAIYKKLSSRSGSRLSARGSSRTKARSAEISRTWTIAAAVVIGVALVAAAALILTRGGNVAVPVVIDDSVRAPDVSVRIDGKKTRLATIGKTLELAPGPHELEIFRGDRIVKTDNFQVSRGRNEVLSITLAGEPAPQPTTDEKPAASPKAAEPPEQVATTEAPSVPANAKTETPTVADPPPAKRAADGVDVAPKGNPTGPSPDLLVAPFDESAARQAQAAWAATLKTSEETTNSIGMKLKLIPAGEFLMGSPESEEGHSAAEQQHRVKLTKPFYLGVYEVTQAEYERVTGTNPSHFESSAGGKDQVSGQDTSRFPVENVGWNDALAFCEKLGQIERKIYRLPTEAEWEYACRAGTTMPFHFGAQLNGEQANANGDFPYGTTKKGPNLGRTATVGSYAPNAFGLFDMHGNVWEWCSDWYADDYFENSPVEDPQGPSAGSLRVLRGGGWFAPPVGFRSSYRGSIASAPRSGFYVSVGFRVVCE